MSQMVASLFGAPGAAANANNYVNNAASNFQYGSGPTLQYYTRAAENAMRPAMNQQITNALDAAAAQGLGRSGAGQYDIGQAGANAGASMAGAIAPIYSQALGIQGGIQSQAPALEADAYNQAIQNGYQAVGGLTNLAGDFFGLPGMAGGGGGSSFYGNYGSQVGSNPLINSGWSPSNPYG